MNAPTSDRIRDRLSKDFLTPRLIENNLRGYWCEAMVAEALGEGCKIVSSGWYPWDLQIGPSEAAFPQRIRIQVKNSARIQTWNAETGKISDCLFNLKYSRRPKYFSVDSPNVPCEEVGFLCDVFILCYHPVTDAVTADHTDPDQWQFFLVPVVGPNSGVTEKEASDVDRFVRTTGRPANCVRRPETISKGIRGRRQVNPVSFKELTLSYLLAKVTDEL